MSARAPITSPLTAPGEGCQTRRDLHANGSSAARARWVVVVPLEDATLFDYLTKSFASIPDVSVVLERRRGRPAGEAPARDGGGEDRRTQARVVSSFGCAVIRRQPQVVPDTSPSHGRTLLWPNLRITDVLTWTEESALRRADAPPPHARTK
jgi:hypothetical protein